MNADVWGKQAEDWRDQTERPCSNQRGGQASLATNKDIPHLRHRHPWNEVTWQGEDRIVHRGGIVVGSATVLTCMHWGSGQRRQMDYLVYDLHALVSWLCGLHWAPVY